MQNNGSTRTMRIQLLLTILLFPACLYAQDSVLIRGRILNEKGEAVEYVQVGLPERHIGTISDMDGQFEISVPPDTLVFCHVSYETACYPVTGPEEDIVIVLHEQELPAAVFIGGDTREKFLVRPGTKVMGGLADFYRPSTGGLGGEMGSIAKVRKPFLIQDIMFSIKANYIPGCVASINIYRIEGEPETFVNVLHRPLYVNICISDTPQEFDVQPEEPVLLEPGKYYITFQIVSTDAEVVRKYLETPEPERDSKAMHLFTTLYFKSSYQRLSAMGEFKPIPVNIGMAVKGLEYQ